MKKTRAGKSHDYGEIIALKKLRFKILSVQAKTQGWRYQIPPVEECFRIDMFSCRISVYGRPNRRNEAAFFRFLQLRSVVTAVHGSLR